MPKQLKVFVSHSGTDAAFAEQLARDLRGAGVDVWIDTTDVKSDDFVDKINEGLTGAHWVVLVLSQQALASPYVRLEIDAALYLKAQRKLCGVIPIIAEPSNLEDMPPVWAVLHRVDATTNYSAALDLLFDAFVRTLPSAEYDTLGRPKTLSALSTIVMSWSRQAHPTGRLADSDNLAIGDALRNPTLEEVSKAITQVVERDSLQPHQSSNLHLLEDPVELSSPRDQSMSTAFKPTLEFRPGGITANLLPVGTTKDYILEVWMRGGRDIRGHAQPNFPAVSVTPTEIDASVPSLQVCINTADLALGQYHCTVAVSIYGGEVWAIPITFEVVQPPPRVITPRGMRGTPLIDEELPSWLKERKLWST